MGDRRFLNVRDGGGGGAGGQQQQQQQPADRGSQGRTFQQHGRGMQQHGRTVQQHGRTMPQSGRQRAPIKLLSRNGTPIENRPGRPGRASATTTAKSGPTRPGMKETNAAVSQADPLRDATKPKGKAPTPKLKLIVRSLPPDLDEAEFMSATREWINDASCEWFRFVSGKESLSLGMAKLPARAYAKFRTLALLSQFERAFNGHVFVDTKGGEYKCVIERAPFQKIPKLNAKPDSRQGSLHQDSNYKSFLKSLSEALVEANPSQNEPPPSPVTTTPLIEYLRNKKASSEKSLASKKSKAGEKTRSDNQLNKKQQKERVAANKGVKGKNVLQPRSYEPNASKAYNGDYKKHVSKSGAQTESNQHTRKLKKKTKGSAAEPAAPQTSANTTLSLNDIDFPAVSSARPD